jgi:hypothetical protein
LRFSATNVRAASSSWRSRAPALNAVRGSRATHDHAIEGKVNALLAQRTNNVVLEGIERDRFPANGMFPKIEEDDLGQAAETVRNAALNDAAHSQRVVRNDVEGDTRCSVREALGLRDRINGRNESDDAIEIGLVFCKRRKLNAPFVVDVAHQNAGPKSLPFRDGQRSRIRAGVATTVETQKGSSNLTIVRASA